MTAARAARLPRSARREQLLGAAQDVFVARGYHAAAMDEIAERAGVTKPVLYQHFPGKHELYLALLDASTGELVRRVTTALRSHSDNAERVAASVSAYFDFVDREGSAYRLVFESDLRNDPAVRRRVEESLASCVSAVAAAITEDAGVDAEEARLLAVGLSGLAEVSARWWLDAGGAAGPLPRARAVELLTGLAWRGISGLAPRSLPASSAPAAAHVEAVGLD